MHSRNELIGNIGRPPQSRNLPSGTVVTTFDLATTDRYKNKDGEWQNHTDWHRVEFFGKTAEYIRDNITSGSLVMVVGKNKTEAWIGEDGIERYFTKVRGDEFKPFYIKPADDSNAAAQNTTQQAATNTVRDEQIQTSSPHTNTQERPVVSKDNIPEDTFEKELPDNFMSLPPKRN
jgi:single-strand DNA-binding protein